MKKRSKVGTMCVVAMSIGAVGLGTVHCDKKKNNKDKTRQKRKNQCGFKGQQPFASQSFFLA